MESFKDKVVVITGGGSGLGRALANSFAAAGARLALGDVEMTALDAVTTEIAATGAAVFGERTDVSNADDVESLAARTISTYGTVDVVCLNAGVAGVNGPLESLSAADWAWTLGVNLGGMLNGVRAFLPRLRDRPGEGHLVFTASVAGLLSFPNSGCYSVSKHAVVAVAETLFAELQPSRPDIGVTCVCPGIMSTRLTESDRNRPDAVAGAAPLDPAAAAARQVKLEAIKAVATSPEDVAEMVLHAVRTRKFWLFNDDVYDPAIAERLDSIRHRQDPPARGSMVDYFLDRCTPAPS